MEIRITKKILRDFGLLVGLGIPLLFGYLIPLIFGHELRNWTLLVGMPILIIGIISPQKLKYPYKIWMQIGLILGWLNSRLILGLIFFLILLPISFLMRVFKYDPLKLKLKNSITYKENKKDIKFDLTKIF